VAAEIEAKILAKLGVGAAGAAAAAAAAADVAAIGNGTARVEPIAPKVAARKGA
jgi:recombination protein RecA